MSDEKVLLCEGYHLDFVSRNKWEYVERIAATGIVGIIAITDDDKLLLVEQYRPPINASVIELPAGLVGDLPGQKHEPLQRAVQRELLEETGYQAGSLEYLFEGVVSPGISNERITFFKATQLAKINAGGGDDSESIMIHEIPLDQLNNWLEKKKQCGVAIDIKIHCLLSMSLFS